MNINSSNNDVYQHHRALTGSFNGTVNSYNGTQDTTISNRQPFVGSSNYPLQQQQQHHQAQQYQQSIIDNDDTFTCLAQPATVANTQTNNTTAQHQQQQQQQQRVNQHYSPLTSMTTTTTMNTFATDDLASTYGYHIYDQILTPQAAPVNASAAYHNITTTSLAHEQAMSQYEANYRQLVDKFDLHNVVGRHHYHHSSATVDHHPHHHQYDNPHHERETMCSMCVSNISSASRAVDARNQHATCYPNDTRQTMACCHRVNATVNTLGNKRRQHELTCSAGAKTLWPLMTGSTVTGSGSSGSSAPASVSVTGGRCSSVSSSASSLMSLILSCICGVASSAAGGAKHAAVSGSRAWRIVACRLFLVTMLLLIAILTLCLVFVQQPNNNNQHRVGFHNKQQLLSPHSPSIITPQPPPTAAASVTVSTQSHPSDLIHTGPVMNQWRQSTRSPSLPAFQYTSPSVPSGTAQPPVSTIDMHLPHERPQDSVMSPSMMIDSQIGPQQAIQNPDHHSQSSLGEVLTSKLVIGEFVIVSQNYSASIASPRSTLAENIVKLMDQVFLAYEVRNFYSRTEITKISPADTNNGYSGGILVEFRVILTQSIEAAAPQFGWSLHESLQKSNRRLAGQPSLVVDLNSIRLTAVPDKDLQQGIVPPALVPPELRVESGAEQQQPEVISSHGSANNPGPVISQQPQVVWSEWSKWSSCHDKNAKCDPTRIHSRVRKCISQLTGEELVSDECKARFGADQQTIEISDCARECLSSSSSVSLVGQVSAQQPSVSPLPMAQLGGVISDNSQQQAPLTPDSIITSSSTTTLSTLLDQTNSPAGATVNNNTDDNTLPLAAPPSMPTVGTTAGGGTMGSPPAVVGHTEHGATGDIAQLPPTLGKNSFVCSNCTSNEICLMPIRSKVAFCATIKDARDSTGCGGWCTGESQLCQALSPTTYRCIHDSECLPNEWQCSNSACIPSSRRCDGHPNCYDSSDELNCPDASES